MLLLSAALKSEASGFSETVLEDRVLKKFIDRGSKSRIWRFRECGIS
jgi:hypothetical protein